MSLRGAFVWHELMTSDIKAAATFYSKVVPWTAADSGMTDPQYWIFSAGDAMVGGLMAIPEDARKMGAPPMWTGYIGVDDVDAAAKKLVSLGGKVHREPADIPNVGRFAVVADPQGAVFELFHPASIPPGEPPPPHMPGLVGWNELYATDLETAFAFYAGMFGWTKGLGVDMGPMGVYQLFQHAGRDIGGMMTKPPQAPAPGWMYYFNAGDIDAAAKRTTDAGGKIVNGPMEVPGGDWIVQAMDPQGAMFALVGKRKT